MKTLALLLGLIAAVPSPRSTAVYEYVDYSQSEAFAPEGAITRIDTDSKKITGGHSTTSIFVCPPDDSYSCIYGNVFNFAVPKAPLRVGNAWSKNRFDYHVVREQDLILAGLSEPVFVISAIRKDEPKFPYESTFYYSSAHGLIAVRIYYPKTQRGYFFLLSGSRGFPL